MTDERPRERQPDEDRPGSTEPATDVDEVESGEQGGKGSMSEEVQRAAEREEDAAEG